jgi:hypothetical protein
MAGLFILVSGFQLRTVSSKRGPRKNYLIFWKGSNAEVLDSLRIFQYVDTKPDIECE